MSWVCPDDHDDHNDPDDHDDHEDHEDYLDHDDNRILKEVGSCTQASWNLYDRMRTHWALPRRSLKLIIDNYSLSPSISYVGVELPGQLKIS